MNKLIMHMNDILIENTFRQDVISGLSAPSKFLNPKYFYDAKGDELFRKIMHCPEYYLTRAETDILNAQATNILSRCMEYIPTFDIVELGSGDGSKTLILLQEALNAGCCDHFYPIDISEGMIGHFESILAAQLPDLQVTGLAGDYFEQLENLREMSGQPKLVLFLGATAGNMLPDEALSFFKKLRSFLNHGDLLLTGFDLKKDPQTILNAYNDANGLTKAFNLNLLLRINEELRADFIVDQFEHYPVYDPASGSCKSYLISQVKQQVRISNDAIIDFEKYEPIYMEVSQKYNVSQIEELGASAGFEALDSFYDSQNRFTDVLWRVTN
jgi:L-histidine N-alpha-methyltransferase